MNFRTLRYFLTVCEMGTINAAARKLYISQQSLSQNMHNLEVELDTRLFHRDTPLILTEAGECFRSTAQDILDRLDRMDAELSALKGVSSPQLNIALLDYGIPDFVPMLLEEFMNREPSIIVNLHEIHPLDPLPEDCTLFISARELGSDFRCEVMFYDKPVICVQDSLLQYCYGKSWQEHRTRLEQGDIHALDGCPFICYHNTPMQQISQLIFDQNNFQPHTLPINGSPAVVTQFCTSGRAATISLEAFSESSPDTPPIYPIRNVPQRIPTVFLCYRADTVLPNPAQRFLELTRRYFKHFEPQTYQRH